MLAFPLIVWCAAAPLRLMIAGAAVAAAAMLLQPLLIYGVFFLAGASLAGAAPRWRLLEAAPAQWLGKISYSLYLSHWVVLSALGPWWGFAAALPVAWTIWWLVERPSILASRKIFIQKTSAEIETELHYACSSAFQ